MMILTEDGQLNEKNKEFTTQQKRTIKIGRRAKERWWKQFKISCKCCKKISRKGSELLI